MIIQSVLLLVHAHVIERSVPIKQRARDPSIHKQEKKL